jgi:hypothetical protein
MGDDDDLIKHREIVFSKPHPDPRQAHSAMLLLGDVDGVVAVDLLDEDRIGIGYDLRSLCYEEIQQALTEVGFHLDQGLLQKLRHALWTYTEATQRANLGLDPKLCGGSCAEKVFVRHYRSRAHGCRDDRPQHWRRYL